MSTEESVQIAPDIKTPGDGAKTFGSDAFSASCIYTEVFLRRGHILIVLVSIVLKSATPFPEKLSGSCSI